MKSSRRCSNSNLKSGRKEQAPEFPAWQVERENRLHRQFKRVAGAMQRGKSLNDALYQFQYFWRGQHYRSDRTKPVRFSMQTLRRLFYQWRAGCGVASALRLRFTTSRPTIPAPVLERFAKFCAAIQFPSLKAACESFANRPGSFVRARQPGQRRPAFRYQTVRRYFPASVFQALQATHAEEATAKADRARLLAQSIADIRRRLPDRHKRTRRTGATISLDSAAL